MDVSHDILCSNKLIYCNFPTLGELKNVDSSERFSKNAIMLYDATNDKIIFKSSNNIDSQHMKPFTGTITQANIYLASGGIITDAPNQGDVNISYISPMDGRLTGLLADSDNTTVDRNIIIDINGVDYDVSCPNPLLVTFNININKNDVIKIRNGTGLATLGKTSVYLYLNFNS